MMAGVLLVYPVYSPLKAYILSHICIFLCHETMHAQVPRVPVQVSLWLEDNVLLPDIHITFNSGTLKRYPVQF